MSKPRIGRLRPPIPILLTVVLGLAACGEDDGGGPPHASDVPRGAVAVVGDQQITKAQLGGRVAALRRAQRNGDKQTAAQLEQQAVALLLQETTLEQEGRDRGVNVTDVEVRQRLAGAKTQFRDRRAYRRFLGNQTEADLLVQLRVQMLSDKIAEAAREDGANPKQVTEDMQRRWRDRTACAKGYAAASCGNGG